MAASVSQWETAIAEVKRDEVIVRGRRLTDLIETTSYAQMMYLVATGRDPTAGQTHVLDALLVSLMEHGISPSSTIARMMASYGVPVQVAVAAGVMTFGDWHGGACEGLALWLSKMVHDTREQGSTDLAAALRAAASVAVAERRRAGERLDGFGHPQHDADPRVSILLDIAREAGVFGDHCALLLHVEDALAEASGRRIAANIDGVCAALVLDLGLDPQLARVCVLAARVVGLGTHCVEELVQGNRWRHVDSSSVSYVGPTPTPESQR